MIFRVDFILVLLLSYYGRTSDIRETELSYSYFILSLEPVVGKQIVDILLKLGHSVILLPKVSLFFTAGYFFLPTRLVGVSVV